MTDKAYAVPLHEQLASVPRDARLIIDDADGRGTRFIPVGRMCHEAAEALRARLAQPEPEPVACAECERLKDALKRANGLAEHFERAWYLRGDEIERLTAQPEQEPVAWNPAPGTIDTVPLYTAPPQREWQGLTDEDVKSIVFVERSWADAVRKVEAKLKEKNAPDL